MALRGLLPVLLGLSLSLGAYTGRSEQSVRAIGAESLPAPDFTTTTPPPPTTSSVPTTAPPLTATSRPAPPPKTTPAPRPAVKRTTTTTARPTTTTLPPAFQVPAENLVPTPNPLPTFAQPGYYWDTGWAGDPANVDMTPPYQPPDVLAVTSTKCYLNGHTFTSDTWTVHVSLHLKGGRHWRFPQRPTGIDGSDGSAGTGTFIEYINAPVQPPDYTPGTVVDFPLKTVHLNSPTGMQLLALTQPIIAHCTLR